MSLAAPAVRAATASGGLSTTTLAVVGLGTFCLANPEKALQMLQRALLAVSDGKNGESARTGGSTNTPTPIVIHAGNGGGNGGAGRTLYATVWQLSIGAGLCWGSYVLLVSVLPEQAKNLLPVTQGTFKQAVTSLGKGLLHVKDALSAELQALLQQQTELSHQQDETHEQVLYVQDQVADVHDDVHVLQGSVDDVQAALQHTDKRTTYIARGIRLVTQGMTALLPPDDALVQELETFQKVGESQKAAAAAAAKKVTPKADKPPRRSSDAASRASSQRSRRSGRSRSSRRSRATATVEQQQQDAAYLSSNDTISVSTGTPIRNVVVPADSASTSANSELEEVHKLLASYNQSNSLAY